MNLEWIDFKLCDSVLISVPFCFILIHFPCSCGAEKISVRIRAAPRSLNARWMVHGTIWRRQALA